MTDDGTVQLFEFHSGSIPLLVSFPHVGTLLPDSVKQTFTPAALRLPDTDWFVDQLYQNPLLGQLSWIRARYHRYVIDLNRPPENENLYPGQPTPELCPTHCFDGTPIYQGESPGDEEIESRLNTFWQPYHQQIRATLDSFIEQHGFAMMLDVHSIASEVPRLFPGKLPDFNFGTFNEKSCGKSLNRRVREFGENLKNYSAVTNGRFVGGYITRNYGDPGNNIHCVQIELSQATYMDEQTLNWDEQKASQVKPVIEQFVQCLVDWIKK